MQFEAMQAMHIADRDQLRAELAAITAAPQSGNTKVFRSV